MEKSIARDRTRYLVLIIYDITCNKRRSKMVKALEPYGIRVQKSAFEAYLYKNEYNRLLKEIVPLIFELEDSLRVYLLTEQTNIRTWGVGDIHQEDFIIF